MTQPVETQVKEQKAAGSKSLVVGGSIAVVLALLAVGIVPRIARNHEAIAATAESPVTHPVVTVIHAKIGDPTSELRLPGNIEPLYSASIYARTEGYLQKRFVDIGAHVKAGQLLGVISSPEVDQQLLQAKATVAQSSAALQQARAALQQAKANEELARLTKERDLPLGQQHAISQQIVDEATQAYDARVADVAAAQANITAAEASVTANQANVSRLMQMQGFERVIAPFDGIITARNVEQGDLVTTGSAGAGKALFAIAQSGTVRIQVDIPQSQSVNVQDGQTASVIVNEHRDRTYTGKVVRSANALDNAARTMRAEVQVDNHDSSLLPGMYADVRFTLPELHTSMVIPTSSLVIDQKGQHVITIHNGRTVHFTPVVIGRDMGTQVEILSGLQSTDTLVASPSDLLYDGQEVTVR